jgi:transposase
LLGTAAFETNSAGYRALRDWLQALGPVAVVGGESTGAYAAGLVRELRCAGVQVAEVNRPHAHTRHRRGKNDPIDAEMAARHVLASTSPKRTDGVVEAIRQLRLARDSAVKARSAALCQLSKITVTAPDELRQQLRRRKTARGRATLCRRLRPDTRRSDRAAIGSVAGVKMCSVARENPCPRAVGQVSQDRDVLMTPERDTRRPC